ncbi:MAG: hypothetical protein ACKO6N_00135 [Myxococcota bacterium]
MERTLTGKKGIVTPRRVVTGMLLAVAGLSYVQVDIDGVTASSAVAVASDPLEERLSQTPPEQRAQVLYDTAEQKLAAGVPKEAASYFARAVTVARDRGDESLASHASRRHAVTLVKLAEAEQGKNQDAAKTYYAEAIKTLEQNRSTDEKRGLIEHVCRDEIALAQALMSRKQDGDESQALQLLEGVEKRASENSTLDPQLLFEASRRLAYLDRRLTGDVKGSLNASLRVLDYYERADDLMGQADTLYRLAMRAIDLLDYDKAAQYANESVSRWNQAKELEYYGTSKEVKIATARLLNVWNLSLKLGQLHDEALMKGQAVAWRQAHQAELQSLKRLLAQEQSQLTGLLPKNASLEWTLKYGQATLARISGGDASATWEQLLQEKIANNSDEDAFMVQHAWSMQLLERGQKGSAAQRAQQALGSYASQLTIWQQVPMLNARLAELRSLSAS